MALDLIYKAGNHAFNIRFSSADWQTIEQLKQHLPEAVHFCFNVQEFGRPTLVPLSTLRESLDQIDSLLAERPELLPYTYQFKAEYLQMGDKRVVLDERFASGGRSGIRIPGDENHSYSLWAGLNELRLEKMAILPDGTGKIVERLDLRSAKDLATSNMGRIQFRKRLAKAGLRTGLQEIRKFLTTTHEPAISKFLG